MASFKEQVAAAARKRCKTREFDLGDGVKVKLTELTPNQNRALNVKLYVTDEKGEPVLFDHPDGDESAKPIIAGEGWRHFKSADVNYRREWLLATMTPAEAVEEILSDDVPESLKRELLDIARELNGITVADAAKK
jgi:hypothetical protein